MVINGKVIDIVRAGLKFKIVTSLPESGKSGVIYFVPLLSEEEKNKYAEYVWLDGHWELLDSAEIDLTIGEDITTNVTCGAIEAGTELSADTTIIEMLKGLVLKTKDATLKSKPSVTLINTGDKFGNYEVGTTVTPILDSTYNDGVFNSYKSVNATEEINAGCEVTETTYTNNQSIVLNTSNVVCKVRKDYDASTTIAKKSDGSNSTLSIAKSYCESSGTYTPKYAMFYGAVDELPTNLRDLCSPVLVTSNSISITENFTKNMFVIAIPGKNVTMVSAIDNDTQAKLNDNFVKDNTIEVEDAGGTMRAYTLFTFKSDVPLEDSVTIKLTIN